MKKILAVILCALTVFGCFAIGVSAESKAIDVKINQANTITLKGGDKATFTLNLVGNYTVLTTGSKNVQVAYVETVGSKLVTTILDKGEKGNVIDSRTYGASILGLINLSAKDYNFEVSSTDGKALAIKLYFIKSDASYSGFTSQPSSKPTYREDIDFTCSLSVVNFKTEPDFKGAVFSFRDENNSEIIALKDDEVKDIVGAPTFDYYGTITYSASILISLGKNSSITYNATPNYFQSVTVRNNPNANKTFTFGKDGTIKGNLRSYYYRPNLTLEGMTANVVYKSRYSASDELLTVRKDGNGCYINGKICGRQPVTNAVQVTKNETATVNGAIYFSNCRTTIPVKIAKASFFDFIGIWFGLLFGVYK
ncbi:MAG: hypothetical protein IK063_01350 [Clostridia bacterium]|nr:hypothetical protein [Clostridia bacterium]